MTDPNQCEIIIGLKRFIHFVISTPSVRTLTVSGDQLKIPMAYWKRNGNDAWHKIHLQYIVEESMVHHTHMETSIQPITHRQKEQVPVSSRLPVCGPTDSISGQQHAQCTQESGGFLQDT